MNNVTMADIQPGRVFISLGVRSHQYKIHKVGKKRVVLEHLGPYGKGMVVTKKRGLLGTIDFFVK